MVVRSDHCPAMKGIETRVQPLAELDGIGSDHCPAMKGIETGGRDDAISSSFSEATTAPQ